MLQFIREKSQGIFAWVIVIAISITFILWGIHNYFSKSDRQNVVAKVNGVEITKYQFAKAYEKLKAEMQRAPEAKNNLGKEQDVYLKKIVLKKLIDDLVIDQASKKAGFRTAMPLITIMIANMPAFQVNGKFSKDRFARVIYELHYSPSEFIEQLSNSISVSQLKFGVIETSFILPEEITHAYSLVEQERSFNYIMIPVNQFKSSAITEKEAKQYYQQHADKFKLPEQVSVQYIHLSVNNLLAGVQPTAQELQQFYQDNIARFAIPKQSKLLRIVISRKHHDFKAIERDIAANKDVKAVIKKYSIRETGKTIWLDTDTISADYLRDVKRVGDFSKPIKTDAGYEVMKLVAIQPAKVAGLKEVKQQLISQYKQQQAEKKFVALSEQLSQIVYENPDSLKPAAEKLALKINTSAIFTRDGGKDSVTKNAKIIKAAFGDEVIVQKNNSDPVILDDGSIIVLRVQQHFPATIKPFAEVKNDIVAQLRIDNAVKKVQALGVDLIKELRGGKQLSAVAKLHGLKIYEVNHAARYRQNISQEILNLVYQLKAVRNSDFGNIGSVNLANGDGVVVEVKGAVLGNATKMTNEKARLFKETMENNYGLLDYQLYVYAIMKRAKIKKYDLDVE